MKPILCYSKIIRTTRPGLVFGYKLTLTCALSQQHNWFYFEICPNAHERGLISTTYGQFTVAPLVQLALNFWAGYNGFSNVNT